MGQALLNQVKDPLFKAQIQKATNDLSKMPAQLFNATKDAINNKNDPAAKQKLASVVNDVNKSPQISANNIQIFVT